MLCFLISRVKCKNDFFLASSISAKSNKIGLGDFTESANYRRGSIFIFLKRVEARDSPPDRVNTQSETVPRPTTLGLFKMIKTHKVQKRQKQHFSHLPDISHWGCFKTIKIHEVQSRPKQHFSHLPEI